MKQGLVLLALGIVLGICPQISQAGFVTFVATLTGVETPGGGNSNVILVGSGTGFAQVDFDIVAHQMRVQVSFSGLSASGGTVAQAEARLYSSLQAGTAYFNIHSSTFPGGEISGFLYTPEPASLTSLAIGAVGLLLARRRFVKRK